VLLSVVYAIFGLLLEACSPADTAIATSSCWCCAIN